MLRSSGVAEAVADQSGLEFVTHLNFFFFFFSSLPLSANVVHPQKKEKHMLPNPKKVRNVLPMDVSHPFPFRNLQRHWYCPLKVVDTRRGFFM